MILNENHYLDLISNQFVQNAFDFKIFLVTDFTDIKFSKSLIMSTISSVFVAAISNFVISSACKVGST